MQAPSVDSHRPGAAGPLPRAGRGVQGFAGALPPPCGPGPHSGGPAVAPAGQACGLPSRPWRRALPGPGAADYQGFQGGVVGVGPGNLAGKFREAAV